MIPFMMIMLWCWYSTEFYIGMPTRQSSSSYYNDEYYDYGRIQTFEIQVLNQTSDSEHFSETQEICLQKYGYYSCCSNDYIATGLLHRNTCTCQHVP